MGVVNKSRDDIVRAASRERPMTLELIDYLVHDKGLLRGYNNCLIFTLLL